MKSSNNFASSIENDILKKQNQQKENAIIDLKNKNKKLEDKVKELKGVLSQSNNELNMSLSEIKLYKNIREINPDDVSFKELISSIKEHGQLQPVLVTYDNYLIAGERRYQAIKSLGKTDILISKIDKNLEEILETLTLLQYSENEIRKNLDNFEISDIFKSYSDKGIPNKEISDLFNKNLSNVGSLLKLQNINDKLKGFIKQFQIYGYSVRKYSSFSKEELQKDKFYQKNKNVFIGYQPLLKIAYQEDLEKQKEIFLKLFENRMSEEELNSEYFKDAYEKIKAPKISKTTSERSISLLSSVIKELDKNSQEYKESKKYKRIISLIEKIKEEISQED